MTASSPLETGETFASASAALDVWTASSSSTGVPARALAPAVSASQAYYFKHAWQASEAETLAELARGEWKDFETPEDAIRWLLAAEDED